MSSTLSFYTHCDRCIQLGKTIENIKCIFIYEYFNVLYVLNGSSLRCLNKSQNPYILNILSSFFAWKTFCYMFLQYISKKCYILSIDRNIRLRKADFRFCINSLSSCSVHSMLHTKTIIKLVFHTTENSLSK